jgi:NADPH:quinone reductase-like Zn-dependent oxidoreductase
VRAIKAETFTGYGGLRQVELPKPQAAKDRVLVHVTGAGVTPVDHTILSGGHPGAKAPLVLGNEGPASSRMAATPVSRWKAA